MIFPGFSVFFRALIWQFAAVFLVLAVSVPVGGPAGADTGIAPRPGRQALGMNLAEVVGWSTELPFIDVMRSATPWIGHTGSGWGGMEEADLAAAGALDAEGWVLEVPAGVRRISTFVLQELPAGMVSTAGPWRASWEGTAQLGFSGAIRNLRYGENSATFDYVPGEGGVLIEFNRGTLRNLTVVQERNRRLFEAGEVFNPDWLARIGRMETLRFMDWMRTNNSSVEHWDQRAQVSDYTWSRRGVPLEILLRLANETGAEPWFTLPHLADDAYIDAFATLVLQRLRPDLRAWFEYSNEMWNWSFQQANWAEQNARARWGREWAWVQFAAVRAAEVMRRIDAVYGAQTARRVRVLGLFTGWIGLEQDMLRAPDYLAEDRANRPPSEFFDVLAITGYFTADLHTEEKRALVRGWLRESRRAAEQAAGAQGLSGPAREEFIAAHRFDRAIEIAGQELLDGSISGSAENSVRDLVERTFAYHAGVAAEFGLGLVMYEGGTHLVVDPSEHGDAEMVAFFTALNYSEAMGRAYRALIEGWQRVTPAPFTAYMDIGRPSHWGSWGALRHLDDSNPRWDALIEATAP